MNIHWKDWCWRWNCNTLATWFEELTHLKRPWSWERLKAGGEGKDRGWDGWMASPTQWTGVWVNSGSWWWTGRPGVLQSVGLQRVGRDSVTELNWFNYNLSSPVPFSPGTHRICSSLSWVCSSFPSLTTWFASTYFCYMFWDISSIWFFYTCFWVLASPLLYLWTFLVLITYFQTQGNLLCLSFTHISSRISFFQ